MFGRRGFRSGSLAEVAEQAGVTAAGILYHFGSKDELLLAVIRDRDLRQVPILLELATVGGLASLTGAVRFAEIAEAEPNLMALHTVLEIESLDPDSPAHEYFQTRNRVLLDGISATLLESQLAGEIRTDVDPTRIARQILAFEYGAAVLWLKNPDASLTEMYRDYFDPLVEFLRPIDREAVDREA